MIGRDNTDANSIQQGMQGIDQMNLRAEQQRQLNRPIPQAAADYIQHLLKNPHIDAAQLGREAAQHPEVADWLKQGVGGSVPSPSVSNVGPGQGPGQPALYNPAGQGPAAGPGGGVQSYSPPMPGPSQDDQTYGTNGGRPSGNATGIVGQAPQRSLGDIQAQSHGQSAQAVGYNPPQLSGGVGDGGASFMHGARTQSGPVAGAPQPSYQQSLAQSGPAMQPGGGPQVPRQDFGTPSFQGGDTMSYRELQAIQPMIPGAQAAQRAAQVAQIGADSRTEGGALKSQTQAFTAKLRAAGVSEQALVKLGLGQVKEEGLQQRAVESENGKTERARIAADATKSAAGIRAKAGEDPDEKRLRNLESRIQALKSKTDWEAQPDLKDMVQEFEQEADAAAERLGKPRRQKGTSKPQPKAPGAKALGKVPDAAVDAARAKVPAGQILIRRNGKLGAIPPDKFNSATDTKL